jgi:hypothetical protein
MYAIITKKESSIIDLVWLCDKYELTDGVLICQYEEDVNEFSEITSETHNVYEFNGEIPDDYGSVPYNFENGTFIK